MLDEAQLPEETGGFPHAFTKRAEFPTTWSPACCGRDQLVGREHCIVAGDDSIGSGAAGRYATAMFDLATEEGALDVVAGDLSHFSTMLDESRDLERLVRSPVFSAGDQERALTSLLGKAGMSPLSVNFFRLLAANRRLFVSRDAIKGFRALLARERGETSAEVTTAHPLSDQQMSELKAALKATAGGEIRIETRVDPSILGGLIVKLGSRMVDSSLKTKLNKLKLAMKEVR
jgi:F-type H+-transporting ATPase subunit delta